jgi:hypothetical protein
MKDWTKLANQISAKSDVTLRPASDEDLAKLAALGVPAEAISFFQACEPAECAEIECVRLWPVREVLAENRDYVPGCYVAQHGYVVFATTVFGDTFCFDLNATKTNNETPVVLIAHDWDWDAITPETINTLKKPTAPQFEQFIEAYVAGGLDIQPNYEQ